MREAREGVLDWGHTLNHEFLLTVKAQRGLVPAMGATLAGPSHTLGWFAEAP